MKKRLNRFVVDDEAQDWARDLRFTRANGRQSRGGLQQGHRANGVPSLRPPPTGAPFLRRHYSSVLPAPPPSPSARHFSHQLPVDPDRITAVILLALSARWVSLPSSRPVVARPCDQGLSAASQHDSRQQVVRARGFACRHLVWNQCGSCRSLSGFVRAY